MEREEGKDAVFGPGCTLLGGEMKLEGFTETMEEEPSAQECQVMLEEAVELAKGADMVVLALGEHRLQSGEATSNATIQIPKVQMELLRKVCAVNGNVAVVLFSGRSLSFPSTWGRPVEYSL